MKTKQLHYTIALYRSYAGEYDIAKEDSSIRRKLIGGSCFLLPWLPAALAVALVHECEEMDGNEIYSRSICSLDCEPSAPSRASAEIFIAECRRCILG